MKARDDGGWPLAECHDCRKPLGDEAEFRWCDECEALVCPDCWSGSRRIDNADVKLCNQCGHAAKEATFDAAA